MEKKTKRRIWPMLPPCSISFCPISIGVGFYLLIDNELVLGPFQGLPACTRIGLGKGVCGTAAQEHKILCVEDVTQFEGHIACDAASRSELVIPLTQQGRLLGVLDIDSPMIGRFDETDRKYLSQFCNLFISNMDGYSRPSQSESN
jgi:L-methionine (R)-S-oxide reductase